MAALPQLPQNLGVPQAMDHEQNLVTEWANQWMAHVPHEMVPRTTWKHKFCSLKVCHVGHIIYKGAYGRDRFRLCRMSDVHPGTNSVLRSCTIHFRPRHIVNRCRAYVAKEPVSMKVGIQRIAILLSVEDQGNRWGIEQVPGETMPQSYGGGVRQEEPPDVASP